MTRLARTRRTPGWLALYSLGLLCVVFFVLFEVLDVDGSDFDYAPLRLSIKLAEAGHDDDIRRISLLGACFTPAPVVTVAITGPPPTITRRPDRAGHVLPPLARISRAALARALLSDVPPSV